MVCEWPLAYMWMSLLWVCPSKLVHCSDTCCFLYCPHSAFLLCCYHQPATFGYHLLGEAHRPPPVGAAWFLQSIAEDRGHRFAQVLSRLSSVRGSCHSRGCSNPRASCRNPSSSIHYQLCLQLFAGNATRNYMLSTTWLHVIVFVPHPTIRSLFVQ